MKTFLFAILMLVVSAGSSAQPAPPTADAVMKDGLQEARQGNKHLLVMFHASWCVWCRKMDNSINDPACKKFFEDNIVVKHLVVDESAGKKNLENPGAAELRKKYHGENTGIPFWLVFDKEGNLVSDSRIRKEGEGPDQGYNVGCPATEKEVDFFIDLLKKITPLEPAQLEIIRKRFRQNDV